MASIGLIGGTGDLGTALAVHLSRDFEILLGSRSKEKAQAAISTIISEKGKRDYFERNLKPAENREVAASCKLILLTVPHESALETVKGLADSFAGEQILVSTVAPITKIQGEFRAELEPSGKSVSQKIAEIVPKSVRVATAFQSVPAHILYKERQISSDVLVAADDQTTFQQVAEVISKIEGLRPLYLGSLALSGEVERMTALMLNIGIRNKLKSPTPKFNSF